MMMEDEVEWLKIKEARFSSCLFVTLSGFKPETF